MFKRDLGDKFVELSKKFPVVALLGPRQSGKTTLAKSSFPDYQYLSLEDPDTREFAFSDPRGLLASLDSHPGVIFDEIQKAPHLFSYLQSKVDASGINGKYILTGSQNFLLHEKISQSLAGRVALLTLLPLSLHELLNAGHANSHYETFLFEGGYPRIHAQKISPTDWYPSYIQTYIERDIRDMKQVADLSLFQRFVKLCAGRIGSIVNYSDLGRDAGVSYNTIKAWLSLLESSYILFMLPPYFENYGKRLVKSAKLYFYDTGVACSLLGIQSADQIDSHFLKGELFESFILSEMLKQSYNQGKRQDLYFWRDKLGHEIDCLFEKGASLVPIEIKSGKTISGEFFKNLTYFSELSSRKTEPHLIYGGGERQKRTQGTVLAWDHFADVFKG